MLDVFNKVLEFTIPFLVSVKLTPHDIIAVTRLIDPLIIIFEMF